MALSEKTRSQIITIVVATVAALIGGGGGSAYVNAEVLQRIARAEVQIEALHDERAHVVAERDELKAELANVLREVKEGQLYLRDIVMPAISATQTDIAVLKARR